MLVQDVCQLTQNRRDRKRVGRGIGTGHGKTSGRGHKGAGSRSGHRTRLAFEGGQTAIFRRVAKRGQSKSIGSANWQILHVSDLLRTFVEGDFIDSVALVGKSLIPRVTHPYKILADSAVDRVLNLRVHAISRVAAQQIKAAGGKVDIE